jgi:DNA-binding protein H-NS
MQGKKSSFRTLSNEALCKLRDEIAALLQSRADDLRRELERLTGGASANIGEVNGGENGSKATRKKRAPKYRGPDGATWVGRGKRPRWLTSAMEEGKQIEEFLIVRRDGPPCSASQRAPDERMGAKCDQVGAKS